MLHISQDLRLALRGLRKAPVFTAVAVLSIALGIGANTAIFSLVDQVLLRLLPVKDPQQLVQLASQGSHYGSNWGFNALSYPMYRDIRDHNQVFSGVLCRFGTPLSLTSNGQTERAAGELVSGNYFRVLGVNAALGRVLTPEDDKVRGGEHVAMLSYAYWQSRFAGNPSVLGKEIVANSNKYTVVGVAQPGFDGVELAYQTQVFLPLAMKAQVTPNWDDLDNRRSRWVNVFARMKPGITPEKAKASLQPYYHQLLEMEVREAAFAHASTFTKQRFLKSTIDVQPGSKGRSHLRRQLTQPLWVLMAIVAAVLLIACANVANLLLARAAGRQKEIAVRLALGAKRSRIVRQLMVESVVLALLGGVVGVVLAVLLDRALIAFVPTDNGRSFLSAAPEMPVLIFNFGIALATAVLFGLAPALQSSRGEVASTLKDQAGSVVSGGHVRLRKALVAAQVTLSLLLLIGAGLFVTSLRNLKNLDPGFKTANLLSFALDPTLNGYQVNRTKQFYKDLTARLNHMPGVQTAALSAMNLLAGNEWDSSVTVEGYASKPGEDMNPHCNAVSPGFFSTLGMQLLSGRDFDARDELLLPKQDFDPNKPPPWRVAIVNEKFAKRYFGSRNPVGHRIGMGNDPGTKTPIEIIGVVSDAKYDGMRDEVPRTVYFPYLESPWAGGMTTYVRTTAAPESVIGGIRRTVHELDANLPVYDFITLEEQIDRSVLTERAVAALSTGFGLLATLLAIVGLYGVMAYTVARRTREIGIRMALGAKANNVVWLIMREVLVLVVCGIVVALPLSWALSRFVQSQLYGITPNDPIVLAAATVMLALVALGAGYAPAMRAARVDPTRALRYE